MKHIKNIREYIDNDLYDELFEMANFTKSDIDI